MSIQDFIKSLFNTNQINKIMKNFKSFLICVLIAQSGFSQLYVTAGDEIFVSTSDFIYTNESITNDGTLTLRNNSRLIFDADFVNNSTVTYQSGVDKGILQIGSGEATSNQNQDIQFRDDVTEEAPFIELNKTGGAATITRGHMRLLEQFKSVQGTLDANSSINPPDDPTDPNRVFGLTFISPDITTTAVVEESAGGTVDNVLIERYIPASNRAFRYFSSSVTLNTSIKDNLQEGGQIDNVGSDNTLPFVSDPRPGFGTHVTGATVDNPSFPTYFSNLTDAINTGLDITNTGNPGMYTFDASAQTYTGLTNSNGGMNVGDPYALFIRGDRSLDLTVDNSQLGSATTLRMLGDLHIGDYDYLASDLADNVGEFSLIGNPYQAQVDMKGLLASSNNTGLNANFIYVYDPNLGIHGGFVTVDLTTTNGTPTPASDADKFLQPNQAFFAENTAATAALTFQEQFKRQSDQTGTTEVFDENLDFKIFIDLKDQDENGVLKDGVLLRYNTAYSDQVGFEDGISFTNQQETVSILNQNIYLSIDKRNADSDLENVQLHINNYVNQNYSLEINVENLSSAADVTLKDHYLGTETALFEGNNSYTFSIDSTIADTADAERFEIIFDNSTLNTNTFDFSSIQVYPNPVMNVVHINKGEFDGEWKALTIYDVAGKQVMNIDTLEQQDELSLDMSSLTSGFYILKVETSNGEFNTKIVKE